MARLHSSRNALSTLAALSLGALAGCENDPVVSDDAAVAPPDAITTNDAASPSEHDAAIEVDAFVALDAPVDHDAFAEPDAFVLPHECTTTVTSADAGHFIELCPIAGSVEHFRIEGVAVPSSHAFAQIGFGFADAAAAGTGTGDLGDDQLRVTLYGGGPPPPALVQAELGDIDALNTPFTNELSTVCGDVHDGGTDSTPYVVLWVNGRNGADCADRATLTLASAFDSELLWDGPRAVNKATPTVYFQSNAVTTYPTITLYDEPVLEGAALAASTLTCETTWTADTNWQRLCAPLAGRARHVRVEGISSIANNSYGYLVLGAAADSTGSPSSAAGDRKLLVTFGRSSSGASWTWFRFNGGSTAQFNYEAPTGSALYTAGPSTVCLDVGEIDGHARVLFWATGAGTADCSDWSTLTAANALYDSSTDETTGTIWNALLADDASLVDFVKTNNANVTIGDVVRFSDAAVL